MGWLVYTTVSMSCLHYVCNIKQCDEDRKSKRDLTMVCGHVWVAECFYGFYNNLIYDQTYLSIFSNYLKLHKPYNWRLTEARQDYRLL